MVSNGSTAYIKCYETEKILPETLHTLADFTFADTCFPAYAIDVVLVNRWSIDSHIKLSANYIDRLTISSIAYAGVCLSDMQHDGSMFSQSEFYAKHFPSNIL